MERKQLHVNCKNSANKNISFIVHVYSCVYGRKWLRFRS